MSSNKKQKSSDNLLWWCGSSLLLVVGLIVTTGIRTCLAASQSTQLQLASIYVQSQQKERNTIPSTSSDELNVSKTDISGSSKSETMNDSESAMTTSKSMVNDISVSKETPVKQDTQGHPSSMESTYDDCVYIVEPDDTLIKISLNKNVSLGDIIRINNINNPNLIYAGQTLYLTDDAMAQSNTIIGLG